MAAKGGVVSKASIDGCALFFIFKLWYPFNVYEILSDMLLINDNFKLDRGYN